VKNRELAGQIWIADFVYTSCGGICPIMTEKMRKLQDKLPAEIRLVSFSVDPDVDTPAVLTAYAKKFGADPNRWLFLTGNRESLFTLSKDGFKLRSWPIDGGTALEPITQSGSRFALVDRQDASVDTIPWMTRRTRAYRSATRSPCCSNAMLAITDLPALNATLNLTSAILLATGYYFIRKRNIRAHKTCMVAALITSTAFLTSYVIYHLNVGSVPFTSRAGYARCISSFLFHTMILAIVILPLYSAHSIPGTDFPLRQACCARCLAGPFRLDVCFHYGSHRLSHALSAVDAICEECE